MLRRTISFTTFLFCLASVFIACGKSDPLDVAGKNPDMIIRNFTTKRFQEGSLNWELKAARSDYYPGESVATEIMLNYYRDGKLSAEVKADSARISSDIGDIELSGNVDILTTSGHRLLTQKILWVNKKGILDTEEPVKIIRKNGDIIKGEGLRANYDLEDYEIKRKVIAITDSIRDNKSRPDRIKK